MFNDGTFGSEGCLDSEILGVDVRDNAVALDTVGREALEQQLAAVDGDVFVPECCSRPVCFDFNRLPLAISH